MLTKKVETISLYTGKKEALAAYNNSPHVDEEYEILSDQVNELGERVIHLKKRDTTKASELKNEIISILAKKLGETKSKFFREIVFDTIRDLEYPKLIQILKDLKKGAKVSKRPGCFHLIIGDGRRPKSHYLDVRS